MKILVTGSSGHLGEAICRTLQKLGTPYIGVDLKAAPFTTHVGNLSNSDFLKPLLEDVDYILHTATLHKPHVATHSKQEFINTNITGTLNLLEASLLHGVKGFIYTSTTSTFGDALNPKVQKEAVWTTEKTPVIPKNIYGATKTAAEDLCQLFYRNHNLPCLILKTSRFFPEDDDNKEKRSLFKERNSKANEFLNRRVELEDAVNAHLLAIEKVKTIGFGKYIISATTPFQPADLENLYKNAPQVISSYFPEWEKLYQQEGWDMQRSIGRVYINEKARRELGWEPKYDFQYVLNCLKEDKDFVSQLAKDVGVKGYHNQVFKDGPYPVNENE